MIVPNVCIVIVNWNKKSLVLKLLKKLKIFYGDKKNIDIVVVDNASTDGSVEAIKQKFPNINILQNKKNLGGAGGFNTSINYALSKNKYKYIWLLDNDAEITENSLDNLVNVCESDPVIGIAGSMVVDINNKEFVVEAGSRILENQVGVEPIYRNSPINEVREDIIECDYVAICSALVSTKALKEAGVIDSRYFLFWDDMDLGFRFKLKGYKVVCVTSSKVYHESFTDRERGALTNYYYGIRNPLLFYSKYFPLRKRLVVFYKYSKVLFKYLTFVFLTKEDEKFYLIKSAIRDFLSNNWGKCPIDLNSEKAKTSNGELINCCDILYNRNAVFCAANDFKKNVNFYSIATSKCHTVHLAISYDRYKLYRNIIKNIIIIDNNIFKTIRKIIKFRKDILLSTHQVPWSFIFKDYYIIFVKDGKVYLIKQPIKFVRAIKVIFSSLAGEVLGHLFFPILLFKSCLYNSEAKNEKNFKLFK